MNIDEKVATILKSSPDNFFGQKKSIGHEIFAQQKLLKELEEQLENRFIELWPIKAGDKVRLMSAGQLIDTVYISSVRMLLLDERPAYSFIKCKKNGEPSTAKAYYHHFHFDNIEVIDTKYRQSL